MKDVCLTSKNPQSNAICERMHQTISNVLQTLVHTNPPQNIDQARVIVDDALVTAMHAMNTTVATTLHDRQLSTLVINITRWSHQMSSRKNFASSIGRHMDYQR